MFVEHEIIVHSKAPITPQNDSISMEYHDARLQSSQPSQSLKVKRGHFFRQRSAPWNLQLLSHYAPTFPDRAWPKNGLYSFRNTADGVDIYIFDTGVYVKHSEFRHRAFNFEGMIEPNVHPDSFAKSYSRYCYKRRKDLQIHNPSLDFEHGDILHGTSVAGVAASHRYGVAKEATIWSVKTSCGRSSTTGGVIAAFHDVTKAHEEKKRHVRHYPDFRGSVINVSTSQQDTPMIRYIMEQTALAGIPIVKAADNKASEAREQFCDVYGVICVSSIDEELRRVEEAQWGNKVKYAAPGERIPTLVDLATFKKTGSWFWAPPGTSFATPHIAGALAQVMAEEWVHESHGRPSSSTGGDGSSSKGTSEDDSEPGDHRPGTNDAGKSAKGGKRVHFKLDNRSPKGGGSRSHDGNTNPSESDSDSSESGSGLSRSNSLHDNERNEFLERVLDKLKAYSLPNVVTGFGKGWKGRLVNLGLHEAM